MYRYVCNKSWAGTILEIYVLVNETCPRIVSSDLHSSLPIEHTLYLRIVGSNPLDVNACVIQYYYLRNVNVISKCMPTESHI